MPVCVELGSSACEGLQRIRAEYLEMPGMALTKGQIRRLLGLDEQLCEQLLEQLVEDGFLRVNAGAAYIRGASAS